MKAMKGMKAMKSKGPSGAQFDRFTRGRIIGLAEAGMKTIAICERESGRHTRNTPSQML